MQGGEDPVPDHKIQLPPPHRPWPSDHGKLAGALLEKHCSPPYIVKLSMAHNFISSFFFCAGDLVRLGTQKF